MSAHAIMVMLMLMLVLMLVLMLMLMLMLLLMIIMMSRCLVCFYDAPGSASAQLFLHRGEPIE